MNKETNTEKIVWISWWLGTVIIFFSWLHILPWPIGWFGVGLACFSVVFQVIAKKHPGQKSESKHDKISKGFDGEEQN